MALIYKCDRCHESGTDPEFISRLDFECGEANHWRNDCPMAIKKDLCARCVAGLAAWAEPLPPLPPT